MKINMLVRKSRAETGTGTGMRGKQQPQGGPLKAHERRMAYARRMVGGAAVLALVVLVWRADSDTIRFLLNLGTTDAGSNWPTLVALILICAVFWWLSSLLLAEMRQNGAWLRPVLDIDRADIEGRDFDRAQALMERIATQGAGRAPNACLFTAEAASLHQLIAMHPSADENFRALLARMPTHPGRPRTLRSLEQFLVNLLLALGIMGTFFGLILFLSNPEFLTVLRSVGQQLSATDLSDIPASFEMAFTTSLLAYGANAIGRFLLDLADEDTEATWDVYRTHLLQPLQRAFPETKGTVDVRWDAKALEPLKQIAASMLRTAAGMEAVQKDISAIGQRLDSQATSLGERIAKAQDILDGVDAAVAVITERLVTATGALETGSRDFGSSAASLKKTTETLSAGLGTAKRELATATEALQAAVDQMVASLRDELAKAGRSFEKSAETAGGLVSAAAEDLARVQQAAQQSAEGVRKAVAGFQAAAGRVEEAVRQTGLETQHAVRAMGSSVNTALTADQQARAAVARHLAEQIHALEAVRGAIDGMIRLIHNQLDRQPQP